MPIFFALDSGFFVYAIATLLDLFQFCLLGRMAAFFLYPKSTHPVITIIEAITEPVLEPVRKFVPRAGKLDMSGVFVFIVCEFIKFLLGAAQMV